MSTKITAGPMSDIEALEEKTPSKVSKLGGSLKRFGSVAKNVTVAAPSITKAVVVSKVDHARNVHAAKQDMKNELAQIGAQLRAKKETQS